MALSLDTLLALDSNDRAVRSERTCYTLRLSTLADFTENLADAGQLTMAWQPGEPLDCAGSSRVAGSPRPRPTIRVLIECVRPSR